MSVLKRTLTRWSQPFSPDKKFSIATRKVIGDYSYSQADLIGRGYSASVYRGHNNKTNEEVAIKVIDVKTIKKDQLHLSLLNSQIEILKSVTNQPNILHLYDTYTTKNNVYIITECCQTDLAKILKVRKKFPLLQALDIIVQVLSGYLHLSEKGFIHRDLKPANILYKDGVYMIGDFGFAVLAGTIKSSNNQQNVGSPLYMAPESLEDNKYNFSTDMWSIGVLLYQMLKGATPWYASDEKQLYHKILVKPIAKMLDDIPVQCQDFIKGVLSIDPKQRLSPNEVLEWLSYFAELVQREQLSMPAPVRKPSQFVQPSSSIKPPTKPGNPVLQRPSSASLAKTRHRSKSPYQMRTNRNEKGEHINQPHTPTIINQPIDFKIRTLLYYCKFIHRILLILTSPLKYQFPSSQTLERYLVDVLLSKIDRLYHLSPSNNWCKFTHLEQYLKNPNKQLQKAVDKAYSKYIEMYQSDNKFPAIELPIVQKSIHELKKYLQENFDDKSILLMDYLTTLYQLFRLEQRYDMNKFCSLCKLDTIMERNPTQITEEHLEKLNNKVIILGI